MRIGTYICHSKMCRIMICMEFIVNRMQEASRNTAPVKVSSTVRRGQYRKRTLPHSYPPDRLSLSGKNLDFKGRVS